MQRLSLLSILCASALALTYSLPSHADLRDAFDHYKRNPSGSYSNDQMKGWSGPSFHARNNTVDPRLLTVRLPSFNAGCGGIDFFSGSFSIITKDELVQMARGIAAGAPGYFFNLAMGAVCPACQEQMAELQAKLESFNELTQDSCNRFWNDFEENQNWQARTRGSMAVKGVTKDIDMGNIPDYASFSSSLSFDSIFTPYQKEAATKKTGPDAISENIQAKPSAEFLAQLSIPELYASIFGSTINRVNGDDIEAVPYAPKIDFKKVLFNTNAENIEYYKCTGSTTTPPTCPDLITESMTFEGLVTRNFRLLHGDAANPGIFLRIRTGTLIDGDHRDFMNNTRYPYETVVKYFASHPNLIPTLAEVASLEIAKEQLREFYTEKRRVLHNLTLEGNDLGILKPADILASIKVADANYEEAIITLNDQIDHTSKHMQLKAALNQLVHNSR